MCERKGLEAQTSVQTQKWQNNICEYATQGCGGALDKETFERYCEHDGLYCPEKLKKLVEDSD
jgi:hypothetical protein